MVDAHLLQRVAADDDRCHHLHEPGRDERLTQLLLERQELGSALPSAHVGQVPAAAAHELSFAVLEVSVAFV
jgi:hypothetical protein